MAASVVTTAVTHHNAMGKHQTVIGTLAVAGGDYATGGLTIDFSNPDIKSSRVPDYTAVHGQAGYIYVYTPGATKNVGKLMIFLTTAGAAPLAELAAGATPAAVVADTIRFSAVFPKLL